MNQTEAMRILASADRQILLHELLLADGEASVEELSRQVAVRRHRTSLDHLDDEHVDRARVRLVHAHLPHLAERTVVDWSDGEVAFRDADRVDDLLDVAEELDQWPPDELLKHPQA